MSDDPENPGNADFDDPEEVEEEDDIEDDPSHNPPEELDKLRGG